ncbi:protein translocase subunit SecD [Acinetobacter rudis]|uniref:Protein translocase subunit SecD n=1 Tax=Acinetobacter rudis CIP 110305 TaxID=421052 RepID=S3MU95_9GAMM|nr:protein translocase subunit SecD [Acinetobacter rudis]EPF70128.1 protein-export membrane protein SecD [Acinetobacter rudis CIP 110305]
MRYPAWKYLLILVVLVISTIYALPSLYPDEPAVQISGAKAGTTIDQSVIQKAEQILNSEKIVTHDNSFNNNAALLRLSSTTDQLKAQEALRVGLGDTYVVALNLAPTTPEWLQKIGAKPMKLGLDLRGGVHFLLEVDMNKAVSQRMETSATDLRRQLRENKLKFNNLILSNNVITLQFANNEDRSAAADFLRGNGGNQFNQQALATENGPILKLTYSDTKTQEIQSGALSQNLMTLRNRINELGVSEAVVQTQGSNRIVVELPGVQDTAAAKRVLGRTANLEFRMVSDLNDQVIDPYTGQPSGTIPAGTEAFALDSLDSGRQILLNRTRILTGERVQGASTTYDQQSGQPQVSVNLDSAGGKLMADATRTAIGKRMAVLFIESKQKISSIADPETGEMVEVRTPYTESVVISAATIKDVLGSNFVINGMSVQESNELALMLRAGALAAPMYFVEERVIGPSLGQENIDKGLLSTQVGFILVALWMVVFFRLFGVIANVALVLNLAMILTIMSWLGASLTLPGIAGIVITIGMAVDANVLICERIREEIKWGASPKQAIVAGYDRAYNTIFDSNLTTMLVAAILFLIGTGPIKGFAVTLMIGIMCSMFTAITVTRGIVQIIYGKKRNLKKLSI